MKLNYFGYYVREHGANEDYLFDMRPMLKAFCSLKDMNLKNQFTSANGERVYLLHVTGNMFLFLMTRNGEIIKKIDTQTMAVGEIYNVLSANEQLGFASYVYIDAAFFGFASTLLSPRVRAFVAFLNNLIEKTGLYNYSICTRALQYEASRQEAFKLPFIGRAKIEIERNTTSGWKMWQAFTGDGDLPEDVSSFVIEIKPKLRKDIKDEVKAFTKDIPDADLRSFVVRARADLHDTLTDLYIVGRNTISDMINSKEEGTICALVPELVNNNQELKVKAEEFKQDVGVNNKSLADLAAFNDASRWAAALHAA